MRAIQLDSHMKNTIKHWKYISHDIHEPLNITDYNKLAKMLDILLDAVGADESHELMGLIDVISHMITMYDERKKYQTKTTGIDALKFLMQQHNISQTELPEIGSQGVVSEILHGKRKLNLNQIQKLSKRFHVSPNTFIE